MTSRIIADPARRTDLRLRQNLHLHRRIDLRLLPKQHPRQNLHLHRRIDLHLRPRQNLRLLPKQHPRQNLRLLPL